MKKGLLLAFGLLVGSFSANATIINYTVTFGPQALNPLPTFNFTAGSNTQISLPRFNSSWGTLTKVTVSAAAGISGTVSYENLQTGPSCIDEETNNNVCYVYGIKPQVSAAVDVTGPSSLGTINLTPYVATIYNVSAYDGTNDKGGTSGFVYSASASDSKTQCVNLTGAGGCQTALNFNSYIVGVNSTLNLRFSGYGASGLPLGAGGGGPYYDQNSTTTATSLTGSVTYDYYVVVPDNTVPEPTSMAMLGSALLGIGVISRRFRK